MLARTTVEARAVISTKIEMDVSTWLGAEIEMGDADDRWFAVNDFYRTARAFVFLFKAHAVREEHETYPIAGSYFNDTDDAMVMNLVSHFGPPDITPFVGMVERIEQLLGLPSSARPARPS